MEYMKSSFFIPIWFDEFDDFVDAMGKDFRWDEVNAAELYPRYLFNYAVRIFKNPRHFRCFRLKNPEELNLYMGEGKVCIPRFPELSEVRFSCFSTGVGFLDFQMSFFDSVPENVADFSYRFKKAVQKREYADAQGKRILYDVAQSLMPKGSSADLFFAASEDFKYECISYHRLYMERPEPEEKVLSRWLTLLKRSYCTSFCKSSGDSEYDFRYDPYAYEHWAGCPEGMVNMLFSADQEGANAFLKNYKTEQLDRDYYFLYLLLLNQRFSAIQYVTQISEVSFEQPRMVERLNRRIVELKSVFAFNIVSDDMLFQNVYSKMYKVLDIDRLLEDVRDNESQMEVIYNKDAARSEHLSNKMLFGISLLSLFSAAVDAAGFIDRFHAPGWISTGLGLFFPIVTIAFCGFWAFVHRKR